MSLCPLSSSYLHQSSILLSLPNTPFLPVLRANNPKKSYISNTTTTTTTKLEVALQYSSKNTSSSSSNNDDDYDSCQQNKGLSTEKKSNRGLLHLLLKIKGLPNNAQMRNELVDVIKRDCSSISTFNNLLRDLYMADEVDFALKLHSELHSFFVVDTINCETFNLLICCYCKKGDPFEAQIILNQMLLKGFRPNVAIFTLLIKTFSKRGRMHNAFEVFKVMRQLMCEPTTKTYNCLLKGLCYVGRIEEAHKMLMNMKKSSSSSTSRKVKPDIYTFTAVMSGFCKVGRSQEALELFDEAVEMGLIPTVVTYNTLLNGYFKEGRPLEGIGLLNLMKKRNCIPDYITYSTILHGLLKWSEIHSAFTIYKEMCSLGFEVDEKMMNTLLRGLCRRSRTERDLLGNAYEVFDRMKSRGYVIHPCAYELAIEASLVQGKTDGQSFGNST